MQPVHPACSDLMFLERKEDQAFTYTRGIGGQPRNAWQTARPCHIGIEKSLTIGFRRELGDAIMCVLPLTGTLQDLQLYRYWQPCTAEQLAHVSNAGVIRRRAIAKPHLLDRHVYYTAGRTRLGDNVRFE